MKLNDMSDFSKIKKSKLSAVDCSKKGSIDESIIDLIELINSCDQYFTTSSCSGRIIVFSESNWHLQKKGCKWIYTSHSKAKYEELIDAVTKEPSNAVFKFEPFILHVQCQSLDDAQKMLCVAIQSGFRNSGISIGKKGKIMMAVRSSHGLEVPLSNENHVIVSNEYIQFLTSKANDKFEENEKRLSRFFDNFKTLLSS